MAGADGGVATARRRPRRGTLPTEPRLLEVLDGETISNFGNSVTRFVLPLINTGSLRQAIVPNHMLGRVISIAMVHAWSAQPIGALGGGLLIERSGDVRLVYAVIGITIFVIALVFRVASPLDARSDISSQALAQRRNDPDVYLRGNRSGHERSTNG